MKGFTKGKGKGKKFIPTTNKKKGLKKADIEHQFADDRIGRTLPLVRRKETLDKENLFENLSKEKQESFMKNCLLDMDTSIYSPDKWSNDERVRGCIDSIYSQFHSNIDRSDLYDQIDKVINTRKKQSVEKFNANNLPKRKMTQEELQNIEIEVTDVQMENLKELERENAKAEAEGDTRMPWERHADQVNYNQKTTELWDKLNDKTKTKLLKDNGIEDDKIKENLNKSFMELGKQDGYEGTDFRQYLSPEINAHYNLPTKWFDK